MQSAAGWFACNACQFPASPFFAPLWPISEYAACTSPPCSSAICFLRASPPRLPPIVPPTLIFYNAAHQQHSTQCFHLSTFFLPKSLSTEAQQGQCNRPVHQWTSEHHALHSSHMHDTRLPHSQPQAQAEGCQLQTQGTHKRRRRTSSESSSSKLLSNFSWAISSLRCLSSDMSSSCVVARFGASMALSYSYAVRTPLCSRCRFLMHLFAYPRVTLRHGFCVW